MSETCIILLAGREFLFEIVTFSRNVMVIKTNSRPRFLLISLKKRHHLKLLPGNVLFLMKMQGSLKKRPLLEIVPGNALFFLKMQ